jgi:acetyl-CoA acyltransferase
MLTAPIPATQKALERSGLSVDEIGVFEVDEAFAPVPLAWLKDIGADEKNLNPNGGNRAGPPAGRFRGTHLDHDALPHAGQGDSLPMRTMWEGRGQVDATILELL